MAKQSTKNKVKAKTRQASRPRPDECRERINHISHAAEASFLELAELLYEAKTQGYAEVWGFDNFQEWATSEFPMGARKAYYFVEIWETIVECGKKLDRKKLTKLGWTKAKDLASVISAENCEEWVDKAQGMTTRELTDETKTFRRKAEATKKARTATTILNLKLEEDEYAPIRDALDFAKTITEHPEDSLALAHVCMEWLEYQQAGEVSTPLDNIISLAKRMFGVTLAVVSVDDPEEETEEEETEEDESVDITADAEQGIDEDLDEEELEEEGAEEDPDEGLEEEEGDGENEMSIDSLLNY